MKSSELVKILVKSGFVLIPGYGKGSHRKYSKGEVEVYVPFHGSKELPTGTANRILKDAGLR